MRRTVAAPLFLALFLALFVWNCGGCRDAAAPIGGGGEAAAHAPINERALDGLLLEARIPSVHALLQALDENVESVRLESLLPRDPETLLLGLGIDPRIARALGEEFELIIFAIDDGEAIERVIALPLNDLRRERLKAAFSFEARGDGLALTGAERIFIVGDQLIQARDLRRANELAPYFIRRRAPDALEESADGDSELIELIFHPRGELERLRALAERELNRRLIRIRAELALERIRRGRAPPEDASFTPIDPEAALDLFERGFKRLLAFAADLERADLMLFAEGGSLEFDLRLAARDRSPLHKALQAERARSGFREAGAIRRALMERAPEAGLALGFFGDQAIHELILGLGGERIGERERQRLEALFAAESGSAPARPRILAARSSAGAGELVFWRAGEKPSAFLRAANQRGSALRALLEAVAGCELPGRRGEFCRTEEARTRLEIVDEAIMLRTARPFGGEPLKPAMRSSAAERALRVVGDRASMALYLEGDRLLPAFAFSAQLISLSNLGGRAKDERPIVLAFEAGPNEAVFRASLAPSAIDRLFRALLMSPKLSE